MTNEELIQKINSFPESKTYYLEQLYNQNRGFIYKTALKYTNRVDIDDLMQEGYIVLDDTAKTYSPGFSVKFISYFGKLLKWRFSSFSFRVSSPVNMPSALKELIWKYNTFQQNHYQAYGTEPKEKDFMRALNITKDTFNKLQTAILSLHTCSFDVPLNDSEDLFLQDTLPADIDIENEVSNAKEHEYFKEVLHKAVDKLSPHKKNVINCYYFQNKSYEQTASELNFSLSDIYALRTKAIRDLKKDSELYTAVIRKGHYDDSASYRYSIGQFKNSGLSSVEFIAIRNERELHENLKNCS